MKLILCKKCSDIFKLDIKLRSCKCGKSYGRYLNDDFNAEYAGEYAIPLGFKNSSLKKAIDNQPTSGSGENFEAFVIPKTCDTFIKINKKDI